MTRLAYQKPSEHRADWAKRLGISPAAIDLYLASDVIDLHIDSYIWSRILGYDLGKRHGRGALAGRFYSQVDLPRIREAAVTGGIWAITTNPLRPSSNRVETFARNLTGLRDILSSYPDDVQVVRNLTDYRVAKAAGKHAAFIGIQGGNAVDGDLDTIDSLLGTDIIQVTLVHLSTSAVGATSAPLSWIGKTIAGDTPGATAGGLTNLGREYIKRLNAQRIFVDLAHISRAGFFDAVAVHDKSQPLIVTHTGVSGAHRHWRNLDDEQIRAIADSGGTIGIMYQSTFLGDSWWNGRAESIVRHMAHIIDVVGDDFVSLGSDWDGMIIPPNDLQTCLELPRLVQLMLDRDWSETRIGKILGGNFLRALGLLRGEAASVAAPQMKKN